MTVPKHGSVFEDYSFKVSVARAATCYLLVT